MRKYLLLLIGLCFFLAPKAHAAITFVQSTSTFNGTGAQSLSKAFPSNVTKGDFLAIGTFVDLGSTVTATDTFGDVFTINASTSETDDHNSQVLSAIASSTGADTITVSANSGKNVYGFSIFEYGGVSTTVEASSSAAHVDSPSPTNNPVTGNVSTTNSNDLMFAFFTNAVGVASNTFTDPASFVKREIQGSTLTFCAAFSNCLNGMDNITALPISMAPSSTMTNAEGWTADAVAYKGTPLGTSSTVITASGTWQAPTGVSSVSVQAWGGGGGGGSGSSITLGGGGGSGGCFVETDNIAVTAGNTYTVTIDAGGAGGASGAANNGANGTSTWFNTVGTLFAQGGNGGSSATGDAGGAAAATSSNVGTVSTCGGAGGIGNQTSQGGGGGGASGPGGPGGTGGNASSVSAGVAGAGAGGGGSGGTGGHSSNGISGTIPGGGGGGASNNSNRTGGNGANGEMVIWYTASVTPVVLETTPFAMVVTDDW